MKNKNTNTLQITQIHGHRGARGLKPENSLPAFETALDIGCDAIEVDLCVSKDNELVISHDLLLSKDIVRNKNGQWIDEPIRIRDLTFEQLQQFDIGKLKPDTDYQKRFAKQQAIDNTRIPSLSQMVELINRINPGTEYNLELKRHPYDTSTTPCIDEYADIVCQSLSDNDIIDSTFIQSFDWQLALKIREKLPEMTIGLLTDMQIDANPPTIGGDAGLLWTNNFDITDFPNIVHMVKHAGADVWSCNYRDLTPELMNEALELDLEIYVWTVNRPHAIREMLDFGVHAITTDYPDRLFKILETDL